MLTLLGYILLGLFAGAFSGLVGIGGGVVITPALVLFFGLSQLQAQGTTLAAILVLPVGLLAAYTYWKAGFVDIKVASLICMGFFVGGLFGARLATSLSNAVLTKVFGVAMLLIAVRMLFFTK